MSGPGRPRISLLHATYRRVGGPLEVRDAWLGRAVDPNSIEYVVSMDADDVSTVALTERVFRLINSAGGGTVTAVRNWNAAAAAATGDLLVVIADDLFPPYGWDRTVSELIGSLDPTRTPFVLKVADSSDRVRQILIRHPMLSRAHYNKFGLFSPSYSGVYCDDDFTARAYWRSVILDGRALRLEHGHPDRSFASAESKDRLNRADEYERGEAQYLATWSKRKRTANWQLVPTDAPQKLSHWRLSLIQRKLRATSNIRYVAHGLQARRRRLIAWISRRARVTSA